MRYKHEHIKLINFPKEDMEVYATWIELHGNHKVYTIKDGHGVMGVSDFDLKVTFLYFDLIFSLQCTRSLLYQTNLFLI